MMHSKFLILLIGVGLLFSTARLQAVEANAKGVEFFENKIRPVLAARCYECHSAKATKVKGGLLLDTRDGIRKGGEKGPAVVPGSVEDSLLIQAIRHEELKMPPKSKLSDAVVADFVQWVKMGAPDPRGSVTAAASKRMTPEEARDFWSFRSLRKAEPPAVKEAAWPRGDIDRFVLAKLEENGLRPVADAGRRALIRRVYFDLIGLPPTPEEVEAFANDRSPTAFEKVVDRLLDSPHFGERWGRHWLDLARYAESNGNADNTPFPYAWRYRDYVLAAFNKDKPYDQFIREQVAGDLLAAKDAKERDEFLTATGFLALTSKPRAQNNPDYRMDLIADQIDVTARSVLGLSVMCARCHDHKFDPIAQKEYYALAGIFESTDMLFGAGGKKGNGKKGGGGGGLYTLSDSGQVMGVKEGRPTDTALCIRGESRNRGEKVPRGFLTVATADAAPSINRSGSGRLELAQWLTRADNPLTARVAVNRMWMHLFGRGLVNSPDNFGALGEKPSHPELLDYLAGKFIANGWSRKQLLRSLVLSRAYQLSSAANTKGDKVDPDNVLHWRMSPRRLEAEAIRDAILVVSGKLDRTPPQGSLAQATAKGKKQNYTLKESNVRSVYLGMVRGAPLPEALSLFDVASPNLVVAQREVTTVPAQSLFLMNSPWVVEQSRHFAQRLLTDAALDDAGRVDRAYRLALARPAADAERARALAYVQRLGGEEKAWASFCQALLASAEFRYVE
ncbi:MAG TPA: PSD1 and planctomycete cytochrome C domain-containing protein [Gemmataceae bacterium]